ncbi:hypothetical protein [Denitromonas iodatirespirans]|uniref:Dicarboxylate transport domain-containing protein n=1 Tax=Denitromonas iodatirespirans TaxID=2795389 RepID=A0A944DCH2_DENI1|nr:hypothetical protein [Denitromonas iodatirespirans]MBT0961948.1 hypothetical protein [Denitromonas iodatirespirans]
MPSSSPSSATGAIVICRRVCSPPEPMPWRPVWLRRVGLCLALLLWGSGAGAALQLDIGRIVSGGATARGVTLTIDQARGQIRIAHLDVVGQRFNNLHLECPRLSLADGRIRCRDGRLRGLPALADARLDLDYATASQTGELDIRFAAGGRLVLRSGKALGAQFTRLPVADLARFWAPAGAWQPTGTLSGQARLDAGNLEIKATLDAGGFADASGNHAAEAVVAELRLTADTRKTGWRWRAEARWEAGGLFWDPVFVSPVVTIRAEGQHEGPHLDVEELRIEAPGVPDFRAHGRVDLDAWRLVEGDLSLQGADLAVVVPQFVLPWVAPAQTERWRVAGGADLSLAWRDGALQAAELILDQAGFAYLGQRFRVGPLSGRVPWRRDAPEAGLLRVDGLHWQQLDFSPFVLNLTVDRDRVLFDQARLPVLDGALIVDGLALARTDAGWRGEGALFMEPVSMRALTAALDLPEMAGTLSAAMPGLVVTPQRVGLEGALVIALFDGYVQATGVEVIDPFGLLPRLQANVTAEHLDLAQLTETFSFGAISGFLDVELAHLQMAAWRPVRFEATVRSTPGDYPRRISQRAVEHITALGGAGAAAAIQRSFLRFFNDFGYREIGLSCRLVRGVCQMEGLDGPGPDDAPFAIVRGGGIPALNVIGYNRRVDWEEFIARVKRAVAGDTAPVIK